MSKDKSDKITYKPYEQHQNYLIPPSTDGLIPSNHLIKIINEAIDEMGIEDLIRKYQKDGKANRYHLVVAMKVFGYGYVTKVCSSWIFVTAVKRLTAKGYMKLKQYFVNGIKIESASGRYTFV